MGFVGTKTDGDATEYGGGKGRYCYCYSGGVPANQMPFYNTLHDAIITSTGQQQLDDQPNSKWAIWCRNWCK